jgi:8-oxo-dGTP pyrophosphatase MutT (NUDIX family)
MEERVVFDTPWFQLVARTPHGWTSPHYSIRAQDYVSVVATSPSAGLVLVRQFRPAVAATCLELPSGHLEAGETPEEAAGRELLEETGFRAGRLHLIGRLAPDVGRLGNALWCFYAGNVVPVRPGGEEAGVETVCYRGSLRELLAEPDFNHALHLAVLFLAVARGCLSMDGNLGAERAA